MTNNNIDRDDNSHKNDFSNHFFIINKGNSVKLYMHRKHLNVSIKIAQEIIKNNSANNRAYCPFESFGESFYN